jgi:hypothetical protein
MSENDYGIPERPLGGINRPSDNTNLGIPQNFRFGIKKIPTFSYFVQTVALNEVGSEPIDIPSTLGPNIKLPNSTARITYFTVTFLVNETMRNYYEILKWLREATPYKDFSEVKPVKDIWEEAVLIYFTNKKNPYKRIVMQGVFPTELSGLEFNYSDTENKPLIATAKFTLNDYIIEDL